jgi:F420-dependent oxidoreductase-like protein
VSDQPHPIFGVFVPQGWKLEFAGVPDAREQWRMAVDVAVRAEDLGFDSIWVYDHFHNVPKPSHESVFECWTTMAAISQRTSTIRLGQMVGCNLYRPPALLAKITSTLDVISGGRLDWGIGAGWYENECRGYGYPFPLPKERISMLQEAVEIVLSMWSQPETTYTGRWYQTHRANCDPKPLQQPRPPVWIGGGGEQLTLRVVARHADFANFGGRPDEFAHKCRVLDAHCESVGRDPKAVRRTWSPEVFIRDSEAELRDGQRLSTRSEPYDAWKAGNLVGTPDEVAEKVAVYRALGCSGFIPWCIDYPGTETLERFASVAAQSR